MEIAIALLIFAGIAYYLFSKHREVDAQSSADAKSEVAPTNPWPSAETSTPVPMVVAGNPVTHVEVAKAAPEVQVAPVEVAKTAPVKAKPAKATKPAAPKAPAKPAAKPAAKPKSKPAAIKAAPATKKPRAPRAK